VAPDSPYERTMDLVRVDFAPRHRPPSSARVVLATMVASVGSLAADAALVAIVVTIVLLFPDAVGRDDHHRDAGVLHKFKARAAQETARVLSGPTSSDND
jgi:hypothetical protein